MLSSNGTFVYGALQSHSFLQSWPDSVHITVLFPSADSMLARRAPVHPTLVHCIGLHRIASHDIAFGTLLPWVNTRTDGPPFQSIRRRQSGAKMGQFRYSKSARRVFRDRVIRVEYIGTRSKSNAIRALKCAFDNGRGRRRLDNIITIFGS